jgi:16S rRNA (guanine527-N7)-methyltransferase
MFHVKRAQTPSVPVKSDRLPRSCIDARPTIACMISQETVAVLLKPFGVSLSDRQSDQLTSYLELLLRWNRKINLTSIRTAEESVTRHFGESFYLATVLDLRGRLLDIGSGAGFPALALEILFPDLAATLLEPVAKKRAFLKEVARICEMSSVTVRSERLEDFLTGNPSAEFEVITARAVGQLESLIPAAARCLKSGGHICLWLGRSQLPAARQASAALSWTDPAPIPLARERVILVGRRG